MQKSFENNVDGPQAQFLRTDPTPFVQTWRLPSLTVNAVQASSRQQAGNIINDTAWAKVTIRLVANMDPEKVLSQPKKHLQSQVPWGLELDLKVETCNGPWATDPVGPAFEAAEKALLKRYGHRPLKLGREKYPFVKPLSDPLGVLCFINGTISYIKAHGENESVLLSDLRSACVSHVYLFAELAESFIK